MGKLTRLKIISPDRDEIDEEIISIKVKTSNGGVEIFANHIAMIMSTVPAVVTLIDKTNNEKKLFASNGIIHIKNNEIKFCCDSMNWPEEIDKARAKQAKERAEKRIKENKDVDIERAEKALARAISRLEL